MTDAGAPPGPAEDVLGLVRDGQEKFASGEVEQARTAFARALKLKPDDAGAKAGLDRCERLLKERDSPPAVEPGNTPPWPNDGLRADDFPDSGDNPEATIVDPNYLVGMGVARGPDAGSSSEFPEPLTVPLTPAIDRSGEVASPDLAKGTRESNGDGAAGSEPAYPRYVSNLPGNYPEVRPGGRPAVASPPPVAPGTPPPGVGPGQAAMVAVAYPQMPPGGPSAYPHYPSQVGGGYIPGQPAAPTPWMTWLSSPEKRRSMIILGSVGGGCLLLGLLLGWAIFGSSADDEPEAGAVMPLVARDAGGPPAAQPDAGVAARPETPTPPPAASGPTSARVSAIERPVLVVISAPTSGDVMRLHAKASAHVRAGAKLYTLRGGKKARLPEAVVEAPRAGRFEVRAAEGATVSEGDVLGLIVDSNAWLLIGDVTGDAVAPAWRCEVASGDGISRSPCRIDSVQHLGGGRTRTAARVAAKDAGWLKGDETDLTITVTPP